MVSGVGCQDSDDREQRSENRNQMTYQYNQRTPLTKRAEHADRHSVLCSLISVILALTPEH